MTRKAAKDLTIEPNIRCQKIYPVAGSKKQLSSLKTVSMVLTKDQAAHLAITLMAASRNWDRIDLTAFRLKQRKSDGTYSITVTSRPDDAPDEDDAA